jgi:hypothetical protein
MLSFARERGKHVRRRSLTRPSFGGCRAAVHGEREAHALAGAQARALQAGVGPDDLVDGEATRLAERPTRIAVADCVRLRVVRAHGGRRRRRGRGVRWSKHETPDEKETGEDDEDEREEGPVG